MLVATLLALTVVLPTAAAAGEPEKAPLSDVPGEYAPALRAAAEGLGLSYDELTSASEDDLQALLCDKLEETSTDQIVAGARAVLDEAPEEELGDAEREKLMARLPAIIERLASRYCDDGEKDGEDDRRKDGDAEKDDVDAEKDGEDDRRKDDVDGEKDDVDGEKDDDDDGVASGDIPVPTRVDTGGGGAGGAGMAPAAFGALFAALFGLVGAGVTGRRPAR